VMIGQRVDPWPGGGEQVARRQNGNAAVRQRPVPGRFTDGAVAEDEHVRCGFPGERPEQLEVSAIRGGAVVGWRAPSWRQSARHELRRHNVSADRVCVSLSLAGSSGALAHTAAAAPRSIGTPKVRSRRWELLLGSCHRVLPSVQLAGELMSSSRRITSSLARVRSCGTWWLPGHGPGSDGTASS
jgi:hypothetical protein